MGNLAELQDWALVIPQQVKAHCRIDNDDDDDLIITLINAATKKCEDHCKRAFIQRAITENRIGDGGTLLMLNKRPVNTFASITLAGSLLTEDTDFILHDEEGYLTRSCWTEGAKIVISYNAGYEDTRATVQALLPDATLAVLVAVANWYENRLGLNSESISGIGSTSYEIGELPELSKRLLSSLNANLGIV